MLPKDAKAHDNLHVDAAISVPLCHSLLPLYNPFHSRPSASQQISPNKCPRSIAAVLKVKQHQQERH